MKVIDLLNKIANGEEVPKKIRIDHWAYKFEWKDYRNNYVDEHADIDLMSVLSCDKEELNYEVHKIEEEKKILEEIEYYDDSIAWVIKNVGQLSDVDKVIIEKLNDVIDYLKSKGE